MARVTVYDRSVNVDYRYLQVVSNTQKIKEEDQSFGNYIDVDEAKNNSNTDTSVQTLSSSAFVKESNIIVPTTTNKQNSLKIQDNTSLSYLYENDENECSEKEQNQFVYEGLCISLPEFETKFQTVLDNAKVKDNEIDERRKRSSMSLEYGPVPMDDESGPLHKKRKLDLNETPSSHFNESPILGIRTKKCVHWESEDTSLVQTSFRSLIYDEYVHCDICDLPFQNLKNLSYHKKHYINGHAFSCSVCDMKFALGFQLNDHVKATHVAVSDRCKFECNFCHQKFKKKLSLQAHVHHFHNVWEYIDVGNNGSNQSGDNYHNTRKGLINARLNSNQSDSRKMRQSSLTEFLKISDRGTSMARNVIESDLEKLRVEPVLHVPQGLRECSVDLIRIDEFLNVYTESLNLTKQKKKAYIKSACSVLPGICKARFRSKKKLLVHYFRQHVVFGSKKCPLCHQSCSHMDTLKKHLSLHCFKVLQSRRLFNRLKKSTKISDNSATDSNTIHHRSRGRIGIWKMENYFSGERASRVYNKMFTGRHFLRSILITADANSKKSAVESVNRKTAENLLSEKCNTCNLTFENSQDLIQHKTYYSDKEDFTCTTCSQQFKGRYMMDRHKKTAHECGEIRKRYSHVCNVCTEGFTSESCLRVHAMHLHTENYVFEKLNKKTNKNLLNGHIICGTCKLSFESITHLKIHLDEYAQDGEFACKKCPRKCRTVMLLNKHSRLTHYSSKTEKVYQCPTCSEVLTSNIALRSHRMHLHGKCSDSSSAICGKLRCLKCEEHFDTDLSLIFHLLNNSNDGDLACRQCDRKFVLNPHFQHHKTKHLNWYASSLKYRCLICTEGFETAIALYTHEMHIHATKLTNEKKRANRTTIAPLRHFAGSSINEEKSRILCGSSSKTLKTLISRILNTKHLEKQEFKSSVQPVEQNLWRVNTADAEVSQYIQRPSNQFFGCNICKLTFQNNKQLENHALLYSNKGDFKCNFCNRKFAFSSLLEDHKLMHLKQAQGAPIPKFACVTCEEKFHSSAILHAHTMHLHMTNEVSIPAPGNELETDPRIQQSVTFLREEDLRTHLKAGQLTFNTYRRQSENKDVTSALPSDQKYNRSEFTLREKYCKTAANSHYLSILTKHPESLQLRTSLQQQSKLSLENQQLKSTPEITQRINFTEDQYSTFLPSRYQLSSHSKDGKYHSQPKATGMVIETNTRAFAQPSSIELQEQKAAHHNQDTVSSNKVKKSQSKVEETISNKKSDGSNPADSGQVNEPIKSLTSNAKTSVLFRCHVCKQTFLSSELVRKHEKSCLAKTVTGQIGDKMNISKKSDTKTSKIVHCNICCRAFENAQLLLKHEESCVNESIPRLIKIEAQESAEIEASVMTEDLSCNSCHRTFENVKLLSDHAKYCTKMSFPEQIRDKLKQAIADTTSEVISNKTIACPARVEARAALSSRSVSSSLKCSICQYTFEDVNALDTHKKSCTDKTIPKQVKMAVNDKNISTIFKCSNCHYIFKNAELLSKHEKTCEKRKTMEKLSPSEKNTSASKRFFCPYCHFLFSDAKAIRKHMLTCTLKSTVKCSVCNMVFVSENLLSIHKENSHGKKLYPSNRSVYSCSYCMARFGEEQSLGDHIKRMHSQFSTSTTNNVRNKRIIDVSLRDADGSKMRESRKDASNMFNVNTDALAVTNCNNNHELPITENRERAVGPPLKSESAKQVNEKQIAPINKNVQLESPKIGKLKVKPFAKMRESLTTQSINNRTKNTLLQSNKKHQDVKHSPDNFQTKLNVNVETGNSQKYCVRKQPNFASVFLPTEINANPQYVCVTSEKMTPKVNNPLLASVRIPSQNSLRTDITSLSCSSTIVTEAGSTLKHPTKRSPPPLAFYSKTSNPATRTTDNFRLPQTPQMVPSVKIPLPVNRTVTSARQLIDLKKIDPKTTKVVVSTSKKVIEPFQNNCKICQKSFAMPEDLLKHVCCPKIDKYQVCDNTFSTKTSLQDHIYTHSCTTCKQVFFDEDAYVLHTKTCTFGQVELDGYCNVCKMHLPPGGNIQEHMSIHNSKQIRCGLCMHEFTSVKTVTDHFRTVHCTFSCNVCSLRFSKKAVLQSHIRSEHCNGSSANISFCDTCQVGFADEANQLIHSCTTSRLSASS